MLGLNGYLFLDMIHPLIFGAIMAGVFSPFQAKLMGRFKISRTWASVLTTSIMILFVILPALYILLKISKESISLFQTIKLGLSEQAINDFFFGTGPGAELMTKLGQFLGIEISIIELKQKLLDLAQLSSSYLLKFLNNIFSNIFTFLIDFCVMLLTTFALLHEGHHLKKFFLKLSPLPDSQEELIVEKFNQMNYVTLLCNGLGGLIQGFFGLNRFFVGGSRICLCLVCGDGYTGLYSSGRHIYCHTSSLGVLHFNWQNCHRYQPFDLYQFSGLPYRELVQGQIYRGSNSN